jgi:hypothetical protein
VEKLELDNPAVINLGSKRPNIFLRMQPFKYSMDSFKDIYESLSDLKELRSGGVSILA